MRAIFITLLLISTFALISSSNLATAGPTDKITNLVQTAIKGNDYKKQMQEKEKEKETPE